MLFDNPRTTCQVFYKLFQSHPQIAWGRFYHGFNGYQAFGPNRVTTKLRHSDRVEKASLEFWVKPYEEDEEVQKLYPPVLEDALRKFEDDIEGSEGEGKVFFGKEHNLFLIKQEIILETLRREDKDTVFPAREENPTYIPDDLLRTLKPIILIRHPQLMIGSLWRAQQELTQMEPWDEDFEFQITLKWTRILYDYYKDQLGIEPVVLDSEDFIYNTKAVTDRLCEMYGLDPEGVKVTWDPLPKEYWPKSEVARTYLGHMLASKGVERGSEVSRSLSSMLLQS